MCYMDNEGWVEALLWGNQVMRSSVVLCHIALISRVTKKVMEKSQSFHSLELKVMHMIFHS